MTRSRPFQLLALSLLASVAAATTPQPADHEFHFVVLGDSQFDNPSVFNRTIDQIAYLQPAFVIQVGDLVDGYHDDLDAMRAEWRRFKRQIAPLGEIPFVAVPGNHDLYDGSRRASQAFADLFEEEWGALYHSFVYQNVRITVLNTDGVASERNIGEQQLTWLRKQLRQQDHEHHLVFMHRPPTRLTNATILHQLFVEHDVSHVFYGHYHHYHFQETDGVRYIMTNNSGSMGLDYAEVGSYSHLLQVGVRDHNISVAVLETDAIRPADSVAPEDNFDLYDISQGLVRGPVQATSAGANRWSTTVVFSNSTKRALRAFIECGSDDERWTFSPGRIPPLKIAAEKNQLLGLELSHATDRVPESTPYCDLTVPFLTSKGKWLMHRQKIPIALVE